MRRQPVLMLSIVMVLASIAPSDLPALSAVLQGHSLADHVALGDSATDALRPEEALAQYQAALAIDSTSYEALWKAARAVSDIAKQIEGNADLPRRRRDSLYAVARMYAEGAVRAQPDGAEGHFNLAMVLGRLSRTKGSKERVRFAKVIYDEASRALAIDSTHDGAHHVIGAWHAEVKRLSGIQRFFAKTLFGGGFLDRAKWDSAVVHLQAAVAHAPQHVYHRLELAEVLVDRGRYAEAREHLETISGLPVRDVLDERYKQDAVALLERIRNKKDKA
jgi:tetratricopeptide (TPR) repeat protein